MKTSFRFILLAAIFSLTAAFSLNAIDVAVDELSSAKNVNIRFENFQGKHFKIESLFDIRGIGIRLANMQNKNNIEFKYHNKYSVFYAVDDDTESGLLDAVIFSINDDAAVDHVNNIMQMIGGYLERKFGFSRADAQTLARFTVYYNAVHRGDMEHFGQKYKTIVTDNITAENAGISTKYSEWAGKTKIVIPLTQEAGKGNISSLDTSTLSDKEVTDSLKDEDDRGVEDRKKLALLKQREIDEKNKQLEKDQDQLNKDKAKTSKKDEEVSKKEQENQKKKDELSKKEDELNKKQSQIDEMEDSDEKQAEQDKLNKEKSQLDKDKEKAAKDDEDTSKARAEVEEEKEKNKKTEEILAQKKEKNEEKQEEVNKEKEDIKKDERQNKLDKADPEIKEELKKRNDELDKKEKELSKKKEELDKREDDLKKNSPDNKTFGATLFYLKVKEYMEGGHYNNELFVIDMATKKMAPVPKVTNVCGNKYIATKDGVIVIGYEGKHSSDHFLMLLDRQTLKEKARAKENVFFRSFVELNNDNIYVILKDGDNYYLAKYDNNLQLLAKSEAKVDSNTFISFYDESIFISDPNKSIVVLNKSDLKQTETLNP
ncbi:MAG: hypothetical protein II707_08815 [Spirochaetales bacterium]|nr:hypothetical protein [Spirochaetales bacterium]